MFQFHKLGMWVTVVAVLGWHCAAPVSAADDAGASGKAATSIFASANDAPATAADNPATAEEISSDQTVRVGSYGQIDLHVKDLELTRVLQLLSIQSQRNIVASRNVAGSVSADLYGVDFYEALDAVLQPNGFGYREKGSFIYVYTASEIKAIEEAERQLTHRVYRLNYLDADTASTFVTPLLSSAGSIALNAASAPGIQPSTSDAGANSYAYSDTMIIRDYPENVEEIVDVLDELDTRPKQVLIEATILQAQMDEKNGFGVDFSILVDLSLSDFVSPLNVVDTMISGAIAGEGEGLQTTVGNTASGESGFKFGVLDDDYALFLRALDRVTDTTVIANPKLLVLNRQRADLLVGAKLGYLSTTATETSTTQTVDFLEVGTQLSVRPFVSEDEFIRLELKPSISDGTTSAVDGVVIPNETTQELTTNILIRNGQTVVLGGLFKEDTEVTRNQFPGLGDMPVIGAAFNGYDDSSSRSEVIFLIKPSVLNDEVLYLDGDRAADNVELARLGAREGLLPWSRSRMVASHIRDAMKHYQAGNQKWALWSANLALMIDPGCLEALKIKEKINGHRKFWPTRSILSESTDGLIDRQLRMGDAGAEASGTTQTADATDQQADATETEAEASDSFAQDTTGADEGAESEDTGITITTVAVEATEPAASEEFTEPYAESFGQTVSVDVAPEGFEAETIQFNSETEAGADTSASDTGSDLFGQTPDETFDSQQTEFAPEAQQVDPAPATDQGETFSVDESDLHSNAAAPAEWQPGDDAGAMQGVSELRPVGNWWPGSGQGGVQGEGFVLGESDDPMPAELD